MATHTETFPPQSQNKQPGSQAAMTPQPLTRAEWYKGSGKLQNKVALITGGDSGIGRSVATLFAREGADIVICYLNEHKDAEEAKKDVEHEGRKCLLISGDITHSKTCSDMVNKTIKEFGKLDILVNNAAFEMKHEDFSALKDEELEKTFKTNIFSMFYMTREALKHIPEQTGVIINTASVTAYRGNARLPDYASTKGAIVSFTRSLSAKLVEKGIRVNAVAPGPIWTPFIPATYSAEEVAKFGKESPMKRAGQPEEVSPAYVFLAARDSSYISGQVIHPNGGEPYTS